MGADRMNELFSLAGKLSTPSAGRHHVRGRSLRPQPANAHPISEGRLHVCSHRVNGNIQLLADGLRGTATRDHFEYFDFSFAENRQRFVSVGFGALGPALKGMNEGLGVGGVHVLGDGKLEKRFEDVARSDHAPYNLLLFGRARLYSIDRSACRAAPESNRCSREAPVRLGTISQHCWHRRAPSRAPASPCHVHDVLTVCVFKGECQQCSLGYYEAHKACGSLERGFSLIDPCG